MKPLLILTLVASVSLTGCSMLGGGGTKKTPTTLYSPRVMTAAVPTAARSQGQLVVDTVYTNPALDNLRIAVRPRGNELEVYKGSRWANTPSEMLTTAVLQSLEQSRTFTAVGRSGGGLNPDYRLTLEIRNFETIYGASGSPEATIAVVAKLVHSGDEKQVKAQTFHVVVPASAPDVPVVVDAFAQGLSQVSAQINSWVAGSR